MNHENKKPDDEKTEVQTSGTEAPGPIDDWSKAFAALEIKDTEDTATTEGTSETPGVTDPLIDKTSESGNTDGATESGDANVDDRADGGSLSTPGQTGETDQSSIGTPAEIEASVKVIIENVKNQAINEVSTAFLERADANGNKLIRQTEGKLGATLNDPDIYRIDEETGTATFFNPDTGRPFTGDNPRAQAKAWVEAYNEELKDTFNRIAKNRQAELEQELTPVVNLLKFLPTYEGLDPVRQKMLDGIIGDYEVFDADGNHIGYNCDLNKALAQVNKQVTLLKEHQKPAPVEPPAPTGPALDMPTTKKSSGTTKTDFKSLAEAMEWQQNQQLQKLRDKK